MSCAITHRRALGDELSLFSVQLQRDGTPYNLAGKTVKFVLHDQDGNKVINDAACTISDSAQGFVEYDFTAADYAAMLADVESPISTIGIETFYGYMKVFDGALQIDTFPADDAAISVVVFNPARSRAPTPAAVTVADIIELAKSPRRVRTVEGTVEERSVRELILADQYQANKGAADSPPYGIRVAKTKPGSTTTN